MTGHETDETRAFWNSVARDWDVQISDEGNSNGMLNSDPVLWKFVGDVAGLKVLDAGYGTGLASLFSTGACHHLS